MAGRAAATPRFHYSQTGVQMMADTQTDLTPPPPGTPREPRRLPPGRDDPLGRHPAGGGDHRAGRPRAGVERRPRLLRLFAVLTLPVLIAGVLIGEATNSVTLTPWPMIAFLACVGALVGSIVTLVREWPPSGRDPPGAADTRTIDAPVVRGAGFPACHVEEAGWKACPTMAGWKACPTALYARICLITLPWSISSRLRPGTSSLRESRPSWCSTVAWMSVT